MPRNVIGAAAVPDADATSRCSNRCSPSATLMTSPGRAARQSHLQGASTVAIAPGWPASGRSHRAAVGTTEGDVESARSPPFTPLAVSRRPSSSHAAASASTTTTTMHLAAAATPSTLSAAGRAAARLRRRAPSPGASNGPRNEGGVGSRPQNEGGWESPAEGWMGGQSLAEGPDERPRRGVVGGSSVPSRCGQGSGDRARGRRAHGADLQPRPRLLPGDRRDQARPRPLLPRGRRRASSTRCASGRACCTASPTGVSGEKVHQKRVPAGAPPWLETVRVHFPRYGRHADELCVTELADGDLGGADVDGRVPPVELPAGRHRAARRVAHRPRPDARLPARPGAPGRPRRARGARRARRGRLAEDVGRQGPARLRAHRAARGASPTCAGPRWRSPARSSAARRTT